MNNQSSSDNHKAFLTAIIQKYFIVFGPDITRVKVKKVPGLTVSNVGEVLSITGDAKHAVNAVIREFSVLSTPIVQMTLQSVLEQFPGYEMPSIDQPVIATVQP